MKAADRLGPSASFSQARPVSARRAAIAAATEAPTAGVEDQRPPELPLAEISHNPDNPRDEIGDVTELADTLREIGLIQAITVVTRSAYLAERPHRSGDLEPGAAYVVVDGHRRLAAARQAGLESIKYTVNDDLATSDESLLESAFVANAQRKNLSELEEAAALEKLVAFYGSQHKAAKRLGMSQGAISQRLSLLKLAPALQADLEAGVRKVEHVRGLGRLSPEEQQQAADEREEKARTAAEKKREERRAVPPARSEPNVLEDAPTPAQFAEQAQSNSAATTSTAGALEEQTAPEEPTEPAAEGERFRLPPIQTVEAMPWGRPLELLHVMQRHMTPQHFTTLIEEGRKMM